jgi:hypothetical protein
VFSTKDEAKEAIKKNEHGTPLRIGELKVGELDQITQVHDRKMHYFAINRTDHEDQRYFSLPWTFRLKQYPGEGCKHLDPKTWVISYSDVSQEQAKLNAGNLWEVHIAKEERQAVLTRNEEAWREVTRWEEIQRHESVAEFLKQQAKYKSLEESRAAYEALQNQTT